MHDRKRCIHSPNISFYHLMMKTHRAKENINLKSYVYANEIYFTTAYLCCVQEQ